MAGKIEELDALIIGAGFAGIYQLDRLRTLGLTVKIFEAGSALGGIWYWNCYPGSRVDTEGPNYQFSRKDLWSDWEYSQLYPDWSEVRNYFAYVDRKLDVSKDISFNTKVVSATFEEATNTWLVRAENGKQARCKFLIPCLGFAATAYIPPLPKMDDYKGPMIHTAWWPQNGVDLKGKRVAVIGTGASGVQIIQEAARDSADLTIFQRTPNMALPMGQRDLDADEQAKIKARMPDMFERRRNHFGGFTFEFDPRNAVDLSEEDRLARYEELWQEGGFRFWVGGFKDTMYDEKANAFAYDFWRKKVRARIKDAKLGEKLAPEVPPHPFGVKRPCLEQNYYDVFNQDNVHLVDIGETPIQAFTEAGLRTSDGVERKFDLIILATGFDSVTGGLTSIDIKGVGGAVLRDQWKSGVNAYLGMATSNFPNMLFVYGPQSPAGLCNGPTCAEVQGEMVVDLISYMREHKKSRIESTAKSDNEWTAQIEELIQKTLYPRAKSWYMGANIPGKKVQSLNYPGGLLRYQETFRQVKAGDFAGFAIS